MWQPPEWNNSLPGMYVREPVLGGQDQLNQKPTGIGWLDTVLRNVIPPPNQIPNPSPMAVIGKDRIAQQAIDRLGQKFPNFLKMVDKKLPHIQVRSRNVVDASGPWPTEHGEIPRIGNTGPGEGTIWEMETPRTPMKGSLQTPESGILARLIDMMYNWRPDGPPRSVSANEVPWGVGNVQWPVKGTVEDAWFGRPLSTSGKQRRPEMDTYTNIYGRKEVRHDVVRDESPASLSQWHPTHATRDNWIDANSQQVPMDWLKAIKPGGNASFRLPVQYKENPLTGTMGAKDPVTSLSEALAERMLSKANKRSPRKKND